MSDHARTVKPRKPNSNAGRPIIVVIDDACMDENGVLSTTKSLVVRLRYMPLVTVVTAGESIAFLKLVRDHWGLLPHFQCRVTPIDREIFTPANPRKQVMSVAAVSFFGWQERKRGGNSQGTTVRNRYHLLLDPLTFQGDWLPERSFVAYMEWARNLRDFCLAQGWDLKPTQGATARQALRDPRFYPNARRKVPRATNERVREHLPGNHYELGKNVNSEKEYDADYLDQTRCHHHHAQMVTLPDGDSLYGYGRFRRGRNGRERVSPIYSGGRVAAFFASGFSGMVYGTLWWPIANRDKTLFLPKCLRLYGTDEQPANVPVFWFTEDLPLFESLGVRPTSIIAAWGSTDRDVGISKYATWALEELAKDAPLWKKRLLLAPYGALATRARKQTVAYHESRGGERRTFRSLSGIEMELVYHEAKRELEPGTNNVLHRALIESSNRAETLMFANQLLAEGVNVLCIYVDAIIVETDAHNEIPLYPPWRLDSHLTRLRLISESQFTAVEMAKLPGLTGQQRKRYLSGNGDGPGRLGNDEERRIRRYDAWVEGRKPRFEDGEWRHDFPL